MKRFIKFLNFLFNYEHLGNHKFYSWYSVANFDLKLLHLKQYLFLKQSSFTLFQKSKLKFTLGLINLTKYFR